MSLKTLVLWFPLSLYLNYSIFLHRVIKKCIGQQTDSTRWNVEAISISCLSIMDNRSSSSYKTLDGYSLPIRWFFHFQGGTISMYQTLLMSLQGFLSNSWNGKSYCIPKTSPGLPTPPPPPRLDAPMAAEYLILPFIGLDLTQIWSVIIPDDHHTRRRLVLWRQRGKHAKGRDTFLPSSARASDPGFLLSP